MPSRSRARVSVRVAPVPEREGEHADQPRDARLQRPRTGAALEQHLGIGMAAKRARRLAIQLGAQSAVVVDLAVVYEITKPPSAEAIGWRAGVREVDDGEPPVDRAQPADGSIQVPESSGPRCASGRVIAQITDANSASGMLVVTLSRATPAIPHIGRKITFISRLGLRVACYGQSHRKATGITGIPRSHGRGTGALKARRSSPDAASGTSHAAP